MAKIDRVEKVRAFSYKIVGDWFDAAPTGQGTTLKNYTSGDGDNVGFEYITESILNMAISVLYANHQFVSNVVAKLM